MTSQSSSIQYAYALDSQGALTHISDALRSHTYTCPGCKSSLTPVLGEINAKHFRHSEECCALETYLHRCAKEAFFYRYQQALSREMPISLELERQVSCNGSRLAFVRDETRRCLKFVPARYNLTQFFDQAELEKHDKVTGLRPDVMLCDAAGERRCYVEICVTHPCSQEKIEAGIPILEFKVQSAADIQMLLTGSYSIKEKNLRVFNWLPPSKIVDTCSGVCSVGNVDMSVWSLSDSGRLNEQTMPLAEVDLTINSDVNTWPRSLGAAELADNLRAFIRHADPHSLLPNCIMCEQAGRWENGYLQCRSKAKIVPYTEARQCASYKVKA
ncbi:hypothetical protein LRZ77_24710 [Klebsiella pneumoniae]|uniref:hypothetical protein n=1 Tax=Enterobacteriaceae TaxID=543 RepID=UPI001E40C57E|nr:MULTISPECIES: hypothetical protein [Enterobacteriaceae]UGQ88798.1 hypothetical protein LRZ77_24710 [Klebsiella pneumoniae]WMQ89723.1 hypothetical protein RCR42_26045 [Enterobacter hormaechei]